MGARAGQHRCFDITDAILEEIKDSEVFKDLIESAVASSDKLAELSDAIKENADGLAAAVGSNKQTAEAIIGNALAIADVVVRQTAQQGLTLRHSNSSGR
jgi:hypothetical protein